jgi:hypothetical protein
METDVLSKDTALCMKLQLYFDGFMITVWSAHYYRQSFLPTVHVRFINLFRFYYISWTSSKGNGKVVPVLFFSEYHAKKEYWESGGIDLRIHWPRHDMEVSGQFHAPATLHPEKELLVPIG